MTRGTIQAHALGLGVLAISERLALSRWASNYSICGSTPPQSRAPFTAGTVVSIFVWRTKSIPCQLSYQLSCRLSCQLRFV
jgi:hypothetical protein